MDKSVAARRKAQQLAREGHLGRAIEEMGRVLLVGEADPYDFVFHGDLLVRNHRLEDAASSYEEAMSAYERVGLYRNAIAIGKKILRSDPHRARTNWRLGDLYAKEGLIGDAVTHFLTFLDHAGGEATSEEFLETLERIAGLCGPKVELALRLSELYVRAGRSDRAARLLDEVADQAAAAGADEIVQPLREKVLLLRKEAADAKAVADQSAPAAAGAGEDGRGEEGQEFLHAPALEPVQRVELWGEDASSVEGEVPEPEEIPSGSSEISSEEMLPLMGRTIAADPDLEAARTLGVDDEPTGSAIPQPLESQGDRRREAIEESIARGDWERAIMLAQELRDETPDEPWPIEKLIAASRSLGDTLATVRHLTALGDLLITQEDLEGAFACFREVMSLEPDNGTARRRLARFREMKVAGAEEARDDGGFPIRRAIDTQGAKVSVREDRGVESQEWIDLTALLDEFRDGIRAQYRPEDFAGHYDLGVSHLEMGLYEESIEEFDLVLSVPSLPDEVGLKAREMRGNALQRLERFREAIHEYRVALELNGLPTEERAQIRYQLACALERAGDLDEAREIFLDLSRSPGDACYDARTHLEHLGG